MKASMPRAMYSCMRTATVAGSPTSGAGAASDQADPAQRLGPIQLVAAARVRPAHPLLAHGIHAGEHGLGLGHALVVDMGDQSVGGGPGLGRGLTDDHVEADAEAQLAPAPAGGETGLLDLERHVGDRLAPGQVGVDLLGRDLDPASDEPPNHKGG